MALLVRGKSLCHLCGQVIGSNDAAELFPPALFTTASPLSDLNDSAVHATCLDLRTDADAARIALGEHVERHR